MKTKNNLFAVLFFFIGLAAFAQTARIKGVILDENNQPVEDVDVSYKNTSTTSNENGFYILTVPANQKITIVFSHLANKSSSLDIELKPNEDFEFNPVLSKKVEMIGTVEIYNNRKRVEGITNIAPRDIKLIPGANAGVENLLKTLPGVNSNSELSTQYAVRGGNYDENLVYVNEIEVYRPFLIRSGQQEGLSFTNTDMIQNVDFSAGGFQAKYGDKLSSVLDITYRRPKSFGASLEASFLGGSLMVETASKNQKWAAITGVRYRDNSLFVNSQETETNFRPTFADVQTYVTYNPNNKWEWSFLGNISQNKYNYEPLTRQTNFGTIDDPKALLVFYQGQEKDQYDTYFGALKTTFKASEDFTLKFIASAYHTQEQEYFDIKADYSFGELDTNIGSGNLGNIVYTQEIGSQLNHARNDLDALIVNAEVKGFHNINENKIEWGFKYTREDIRDRIVEWEVIDSAGFSLNPPIIDLPIRDQPYNPYTGPLVPYQNVRALNYTKIDRLSGYVQWSKKSMLGSHDVWYNFGVRAHNWQVSGDDIDGKNQTTFSPRAQFAIKPDWESDMVFRLSGGLYHQPPFYRELRGADGLVNPDVKAQQSIHVVLSNDYSFKMWERPFKLVTEAYYKSMSDVNTYTLDNVRIRYSANNDAKAYATGFDARLNGEFVPGTESWFSFGYMKTEENINDRGYIARPTDQRLKFGILFQDYVKNIPNLKLYLNLVYNTGLPGGSPSYADPYVYQSRLRDYRRADVGFSYVFTEKNETRPDGHWLKKFKDLSLGLEIFNLFNNQNAITNTWVRDVYTKVQYGIPNYMTTRVFNIKLTARL
ncbi:outer membrane receptor protein involved in Fe transport [Flavobacterium endophyticum]|uniref:Outer membrane receptor protein involved in Fe transport n=1 Tax=Flavobacterium endophyticum TaxID=1540163 RepID=A0A495M6Q3_9FLAO|nr:carboxypeptidase-like regulatory domain-containing protein [Flavobacterium endophyticum]RKS21704.1 outer membrane receptor protein involved in Fe transport [Flavobacterium endophyticum]